MQQVKLEIPVEIEQHAVYRVFVDNELHTERELSTGSYVETGWVFFEEYPIAINIEQLRGAVIPLYKEIKLDSKTAHTVVTPTQVLVYESK